MHLCVYDVELQNEENIDVQYVNEHFRPCPICMIMVVNARFVKTVSSNEYDY